MQGRSCAPTSCSRGRAVAGPTSGASGCHRQPLGPADRKSLQVVSTPMWRAASIVLASSTCSAITLKFNVRASRIMAVTMAWLTVSRARFLKNEPSILR